MRRCVNTYKTEDKCFEEAEYTSNVISMNHMFYKCSSLTSLELTNFDTSNVENMDSIFERCDALSEVSIGSLFSFKGNGSTYCELPDKTWYAKSDGTPYTAGEIAETRNNIAETYIS